MRNTPSVKSSISRNAFVAANFLDRSCVTLVLGVERSTFFEKITYFDFGGFGHFFMASIHSATGGQEVCSLHPAVYTLLWSFLPCGRPRKQLISACSFWVESAVSCLLPNQQHHHQPQKKDVGSCHLEFLRKKTKGSLLSRTTSARGLRTCWEILWMELEGKKMLLSPFPD